MAGMVDDVLVEFFQKLEESADLSATMIDGLRVKLSPESRLKAEELVEVFSPPPDEELP